MKWDRPLSLPGSRASGRSGMLSRVEDRADALHPDRGLGDGAAHLRDVCTGLKNLPRYERKTVKHPIVIAGPTERRAAPRGRSRCRGTRSRHDSDRSDFTASPAAQLDGLLTRVRQVLLLESCGRKRSRRGSTRGPAALR